MVSEVDEMERIEALSEELFAAAKANEWEKAVEIEQIRRPMIDSMFADLSESRREALKHHIEKLVKCDKQVMELGKAHQITIAKELGQVSKGKVAIKAYGSQV